VFRIFRKSIGLAGKKGMQLQQRMLVAALLAVVVLSVTQTGRSASNAFGGVPEPMESDVRYGPHRK